MTTVASVNIDDEYVTVNARDSIFEVSQTLAKNGISDAVVLDENSNVLGVLDDYDIVSKVLAEDKDIHSVTAEEIMFAPPPVTKETSLFEVERILKELEASILPVVNNEKKLVGVITMMDVIDGLREKPRGFGGIFRRS